MNFNDVAIVSIKGSDYRIHSGYITKGDAVNIMKNLDLSEKSRLSLLFFYYVQKMSEKFIIKEIER